MNTSKWAWQAPRRYLCHVIWRLPQRCRIRNIQKRNLISSWYHSWRSRKHLCSMKACWTEDKIIRRRNEETWFQETRVIAGCVQSAAGQVFGHASPGPGSRQGLRHMRARIRRPGHGWVWPAAEIHGVRNVKVKSQARGSIPHLTHWAPSLAWCGHQTLTGDVVTMLHYTSPYLHRN